jgi:hypothetical protein
MHLGDCSRHALLPRLKKNDETAMVNRWISVQLRAA